MSVQFTRPRREPRDTPIRWRRFAVAPLAAAVSLALVFPASLTASGAPLASAPTVPAGLPAQSTSGSPDSQSAFAQALQQKYVDPDRVYSTDVRWWLGKAAETDEGLLEEIQGLYDGGFRGVELAMQSDPTAPDASYAYGSAMWTHKWNLMMNKLLDLGMSVYLTSGTNWATSNVPGLDPASQAAMQNLTMATSTVAPGQAVTALPAPAAASRKAGAKFISAYAYKVVSGTTVDPASYIDLTKGLTQGADTWTQNLAWTAPSDGSYQVFALWTQGTYQSSSPAQTPSYATNYFDPSGLAALRAYWETHYLADPALRAKIAAGDVELFMDSLEISTGTGFTWWSQDMASEFKKRKGYDITPYVFLIDGVASTEYKFNAYTAPANIGTYRLQGEEAKRQGVLNDYQDVLTQLYRERMLQPMKTWLNSVGIETRAQISYGRPLEISEPIMDVDFPETESLNTYNQVDLFRLWSGGAKLQNKVLSSETGAEIAPYNATQQRRLEDAYRAYAGGIQRVVWHVWGAGYGYGSYQWPGFTAGNYNYLGSRNPDSADYDVLNAHLGRVQQFVQTGVSRTDVGFAYQNWTQGIDRGGLADDNKNMNWQLAHQGIEYRSTELQDNGYTYDYFSPRFLFSDGVRFDPKTKTIEKAGYKAVVLFQKQLDIEGAKRILMWAKQGLKVVILDDAATRTPGNDGKDAVLAKVISELKTLPTVRTATVYDNIDYFSATPGGYDDNVLEKLQELGVQPYTGYTQPNLQLLDQTRQDAEGNRYVYLYNYGDDTYHKFSHKPAVKDVKFGTNIKTDVTVDGTYIPYTIDSWTGAVTQVADYEWADGRTVVPVDLDWKNIKLLVFQKADAAQNHITSTDADSSYAEAGGVAVRSTSTGPVTTAMSDGRQYTQDVTVPAPYDVKNWDLTVQSWRPNATAGDLIRTETIDGLTTVNRKTSTVKTPIAVKLDTLTTWDKIPGVGKAVSGTGHYESTFTWNSATASGAYLDLGDELQESLKVTINGKQVGGVVSTNPTKVRRDVGGVGKPTIDDGTGTQVPLAGKDLSTGGINWVKPTADISDYLRNGVNTITIDYNSALSNVQLDRGAIQELRPYLGFRDGGWWRNDQVYLPFGPKQAKIVPFVDVQYTDTRAQLEAAVEAADKLVADVEDGVYLEPGATAFTKALAEAKETLATAMSTDAQFATALDALTKATAGLVKKPVTQAPSVTQQPQSVKVTVGQTASFTAAASGVPTPTVKWQVSSDKGRSWHGIDGANAATYSFTPDLKADGNRYRAVFKNSEGVARSSAATLTVKKATSKVSVQLDPSKVRSTKQAEVIVTVTSSAGTPTGTVTVHYGSRSIEVDLKSKSKGVVEVTLPKLKPGTYEVWADYSGSKTIAGDNSRRVTLQVIK